MRVGHMARQRGRWPWELRGWKACITCTSANYELGRQKRWGEGRVPRDGCTLWRAPSPTRSWDLRLRSKQEKEDGNKQK